MKQRSMTRSFWLLFVMAFFLCILPMGKTEAAQRTLALNDAWVSGNLAQNDVDFYSFTVQRAGMVTITYQGWSIADSYVQVMDADLADSYAKENVYTSSDTNPKTKEMVFALEPGTYYVKVWPYGSHTGTYRLKGSFVSAGNNEREPNDGFDTAMPLAANQAVTGFLSQTDKVDFYRIYVPARQKITFNYMAYISDSYFSVWNADFLEIHKKNFYGSISETNPKTYVYEETLDPGTYYVKVYPYGSHVGRYRLTWKSVVAAPVKHTVTFNSNGGTSVASQEVVHGNRVIQPASPRRSGYVFGGWYLGSSRYNFNTGVTQNVTLVAKWTKAVTKYTVKFNSNGGSKVAAKAVVKGYRVSKPANPKRSRYTFEGWYLGSRKFNFNSKIMKNITLTAKWKKVTVPKAGIKSVSNVKGRKIKVNSKKISGVKGYEIQYSYYKNFRSKAVRRTTKASYTTGTFTLRRNCYVRVRAFKVDSKGAYVYGAYSPVKKVTIRK